MPIFYLDDTTNFPPTHFAEQDGLLAIGGDLSSKRIIEAYKKGVFPWYNEDDPIMWWSPAPRFVLFPDDLHISRSMKRKFNQGIYKVTANKCFKDVINFCQNIPRKDQDGTWITDDMKSAYVRLHQEGYAHSIEVWDKTELVGGVYGIAIGNIFFGESMFSTKPNASKYGIISLIQKMNELGLNVLDCQMKTEHMIQLGGQEIGREQFEELLTLSNKKVKIEL